MSRCFSILPTVLPLFALAACVEAPEDMLGTEAQAAIACPKLWGCGENSPVMGPFNFHELALDGQPNDADVRLIDLRLGVTSYQPRIVNGSQLVGYDPVTNTTISGAQLTGAYFRLWSPEGLFKITIKKVTPQALSFTTFWVGPQTKIETYELTTNKINSTDPRPLCNNPPERDSGEGPGRMWARPFEAMFVTGDRYDAATKTLIADNPRAAYPWVNIECAGSAIAKLHLTRHTFWGQAAGFTSTKATRQAMLKMYTSDLCGGGAAFTSKGTPLHWQNTPGWSVLTGAEFAHEAMWDEHGALCLDTHRRFDEYTAEIAAECAAQSHALPTCAGVAAGSYYLSSAVPFAPPP